MAPLELKLEASMHVQDRKTHQICAFCTYVECCCFIEFA